jgi:uncharacterized membrane protein
MSRTIGLLAGAVIGALVGLAVTIGALFMRVRALEREGRE